jgi:hypothetical protein
MRQNVGLVAGPDFGGSDLGGLYRPAIERYHGRFFRALGDEGRLRALETRHHMLILSGLYGLVPPGEPIQDYSCPVTRSAASYNLWRRSSPSLTWMLRRYIEANHVRDVVELTANTTYRSLVEWGQVRKGLAGVGGRVLHAFCASAAGDNALAAFGDLMRDHLLRDDGLGGIDVDKPWTSGDEMFVLSAVDLPPRGWPREQSPPVRDLEDEVERNRRGVVRYLNGLETPPRGRWPSFQARIDGLRRAGRITVDEAEAMHTVRELRNQLVYGQVRLGRRLSEFRHASEYLRKRARADDRRLSIEELETDWDELVGRL